MKKILRNLEQIHAKVCGSFVENLKKVLKSCVENLISERVESYSFCNDVLEVAQNRPQPEIGTEILFSVLNNTIIANKTQTPSISAPSDIILSECIQQQSIYFEEQP